MKRGFIVLFYLLPLWLFGQAPNSWINFSQSYFRIPVAKDGVYRLSYANLNDAGFPVGSVDTRFIQVFHRGVEQAIYFKQDIANARFDETEYIEFYGQRNDGQRDAKLYKPSSAQPHPYYNIYTDTSAYFITWNNLPIQGKRMVDFSEVNVTNIPKETSQTAQQLVVYSQEYSGGETLEDVIQYSYFNQGEGWTGATICSGSSGCLGQSDFAIENLTGAVISAASPMLELQLAGRDDLGHTAEIYVGRDAGSLHLLTSQSFVDFETPTITSSLNWSDIGADGKMLVRVKAIGIGANRDRLSVSYIKIRFAQNFDGASTSDKIMELSAGADKAYVELTNTPATARVWDITDSDNIVNIGTTTINATTRGAIVPNAASSRKVLVSSQFLTPTLHPVSFQQITPASYNYLIITHASLLTAGLGYNNVIEAYADYRASQAGGGYQPLIVTIDQLYNQFNYGETSSLAIYEFMKFMYANGDPKYLLLIGKGREVTSGFHRKTLLPAGELRDLVPVGGYPASDMVFTTGLKGEHVAAVPTGRITASNAAQVAAYLNKVKEAESVNYDEQWHKDVLHLSGGIQPFELTRFRSYMDGFATIAEGEFYGGTVNTLGKHEATAVELINISEQINKGVNMVTFFGHSAPNATDIDIGYVSDPAQGYNNPGKYPSFLVNGCSAGEFFSNITNFGEDWILTANKGARSFIANSSYGFSTHLQLYSQLMYETGYADSAGIRSGIGAVQIEVAKRYLTLSSETISSIALTQQMVMLGDPALKLFGPVKPDLAITDTDIAAIGFDDKPVNALADSFALKLIVKNYGVITKDPLKIKVTRKFSDNTSITYDSIFTQPFGKDTLTFVIKQAGSQGFGNNLFTVSLDPDKMIDEFNEENNTGTLSVFIPLSGTKNLFPSAFSIVSKANPQLVFQNTNLLSDARSYLLEIDTTSSFSSPIVQRLAIDGKVLLMQKVQLLTTDSIVYFWRTKLAQPTANEDTDWQVSSFAYINSSPEGWTQMTFPQFADDATSGLIKDPQLRDLKFEETSTDLFIRTFGKDNNSLPSDAALNIDGVDYWHSIQGFNCRDNTINLVAFNKNTVVPYQGIAFTFQNSGGRACGREPQLINSFLPSETETGHGDDLFQYVDNINTSDSVLLFTLGDAGLNSWSNALKSKLGEFGISAAQIDAILPGEPVIIFGRKGAAPGTARIIRSVIAPESAQELVVNEKLIGKLSSGSMQSTVVGPANSWKNFVARVAEKTSNDDVRFDLYGITPDGSPELIQSNIGNEFDLSGVSVGTYPQLKLVYYTEDNTDLTAAQLKKWFVFFDPVAEGLLVYKGPHTQQTFDEGLSWTGNYSFVNISEKSFTDSLRVEVGFLNKETRILERKDMKIKAPFPGDSTQFQISTKPSAGLNDVNVFVNHRVQPELYYENNTIDLIDYLNVIRDKTNPMLDVSIDGRYVQNGDYVSPNPSILILLKDENQLIYKSDTTGVDVLLKSPCSTDECPFDRISLSGPTIKWTPATATADFKLEFNPKDLPDGEYTLRVQATDAAGNKAGADPFEVTFNVLHETTIRFIPAFPNPSDGNFFFRFLVTGQYDIEKFNLQIWSSGGQLISQFTESELSNRYVGTHELKWGGLDNSANMIQPGVYIYRIEVGANGQNSITHGKLVVIR